MAENLFLQLMLNHSQGFFFFFFLFNSQSHAAACVSVFSFSFFFFFCALVWGDQGLPQYSPCVLWARGAWLSSCHTVAPGTCPVIWPDLLDLSADSPALLKLICAVECLQWSFSNQINGPNLVFQNPISFMCCYFFFLWLLDIEEMFRNVWLAFLTCFLCSFEPTLRGFWGNAFLCFIGNRCRGEHFFSPSLSWTFWSV